MPEGERGESPVAEPQVVVGAAILDAQGRLLGARRSAPAALAGRWEFPGGKVEPGETDVEALHRELDEELGVRVELLGRFGGDWPLSQGLVLRLWTARIVAGRPLPLEDHDELRWLEVGAWLDVDWLPADLPIVEALATRA